MAPAARVGAGRGNRRGTPRTGDLGRHELGWKVQAVGHCADQFSRHAAFFGADVRRSTGAVSTSARSLPSGVSRSASAVPRGPRTRNGDRVRVSRAASAISAALGSRPGRRDRSRRASGRPAAPPLVFGPSGRRGASPPCPGSVGVERQVHPRVAHGPCQLGHLLLGQRRAHDGHLLAHPGLVQGQHVGVALHHHHAPGLGGVRASQVDAEQLAALVVELALGRVQVLGARRRASRARRSPAPGRARRRAGT